MRDALSIYSSLPKDINSHIEPLNYDGENEKINGIYYYVADQKSVEDISSTIRSHLGLKIEKIGKATQ